MFHVRIFSIAFCGRDFRAGQETIATEGEKRSFPSRSGHIRREGRTIQGCPDADTLLHAFYLSVKRGEREGNRISEKGKASCGMQVACASRSTHVRTHARTHACTYARLRECDKLCEEAGLATERRGPTIKEPVTFQILARRAHVKSATLRARGIFLPLLPFP